MDDGEAATYPVCTDGEHSTVGFVHEETVCGPDPISSACNSAVCYLSTCCLDSGSNSLAYFVVSSAVAAGIVPPKIGEVCVVEIG